MNKHLKEKIKFVTKIRILTLALVTAANAIGSMEIPDTYQVIHDNLSRIYSVDKYRNAINSQYQKQTLPDIVLTPGERRSILLQSLAHRHKHSNQKLSNHAVHELYLLSGRQHSPSLSLLTQLGSPVTLIGEIMLAEILISPVIDIKILQERQQALQYLIDHPRVIFQLEESLIHYAADEDGLIALLNPSDAVNNHLFKDIDNQTYLPGLTESATHEEIARRLRETFNLLGVLNAPIALIGSVLYRTIDTQPGVINGLLKALISLPSDVSSSISKHYEHYFHNLTPPKIYTVGSFTVLQLMALYRFYRNFQDNKDAYSFIMERSRRPGRALESAFFLKNRLQNHPMIKNIMMYNGGFLKFQNSTQVHEL
ncbi:hypothetical protein [Endozoicomonas sp.]|uniref:hypothetical protein n=1 Tax=Endozoicomonas sp. TaxID=1892382 RepID=UPI003AF898F3